MRDFDSIKAIMAIANDSTVILLFDHWTSGAIDAKDGQYAIIDQPSFAEFLNLLTNKPAPILEYAASHPDFVVKLLSSIRSDTVNEIIRDRQN